jgi:competence protein ComEC
MGDMGFEAERGLAFPDVDIVMAGHHGSRNSTSERLLRAADPKHVVLSYGRNNYNHPHPDLLRRLHDTDAVIHETFRVGAVRLPLAP